MVRRALVPRLPARGGLLTWAALAALAACAPRGARAPAALPIDGSDITLYRDAALVRQRVELAVPAGGMATVRVRIPAGLGAADVHVFPQGGLELAALREPGAVKTLPPPPAPVSDGPRSPEDEYTVTLAEPEPPAAEPAEAAPPERDRPTELELTLRARPGHAAPGRAALWLGYATDRLTWDVAYTLTANAARDRAVLRGAIAIHNTTGIALPGAQVRLVDAPLADARAYAAGELAARLTRRTAAAEAAPPAPPAPRELGRLDVADGDTRVELVRGAAPRPMRSILVYDPIGTQHDRAGRIPVMERDHGTRPPAGTRVHESFEIERDPQATAGLPAGPTRLLERKADGTLSLLGEARLFEATARVAVSDTFAVGTAGGVTGERERRELTVDGDRQRVVEDFVITIANDRPRPVDVVVREHLYRGTNWTLAYISVPVSAEAKEGPQQVAPRITIPPRSKGRVMYSVVYTW
jgi:hypothetical protein